MITCISMSALFNLSGPQWSDLSNQIKILDHIFPKNLCVAIATASIRPWSKTCLPRSPGLGTRYQEDTMQETILTILTMLRKRFLGTQNIGRRGESWWSTGGMQGSGDGVGKGKVYGLGKGPARVVLGRCWILPCSRPSPAGTMMHLKFISWLPASLRLGSMISQPPPVPTGLWELGRGCCNICGENSATRWITVLKYVTASDLGHLSTFLDMCTTDIRHIHSTNIRLP